MIIPSKELIPNCTSLIEKNNGHTSLDERLFFAKRLLKYLLIMTPIFFFGCNDFDESLKLSISEKNITIWRKSASKRNLYGNLSEVVNKLNGKEIL